MRQEPDDSNLPDIPLRVIDGDTCIAPAVSWERIQNTETPNSILSSHGVSMVWEDHTSILPAIPI